MTDVKLFRLSDQVATLPVSSSAQLEQDLQRLIEVNLVLSQGNTLLTLPLSQSNHEELRPGPPGGPANLPSIKKSESGMHHPANQSRTSHHMSQEAGSWPE